MAQISNKKKHQQFGLKLLLIALIVGLTFTVWYFSDKSLKNVRNDYVSEGGNNVANSLPADDLRDLKDIYLNEAKGLLEQGYDAVLLADSYKFHNFLPDLKADLSAENTTQEIWNAFITKYGEIDKASAKYVVFGNQVKISFETKKDEVKKSFWMVLSFGNYDKVERLKLRPVLLEAALIELVTPEEAALRRPSLWIGQKMEENALKDYGLMDAVAQGKLGTVDLYKTDNKKWKLLFFFPSAYTFVCPTECLGLLENFAEFQKMNVDIYAISGDLASTLQAWDKTYFGGLPYTLVADPALTLAEQFGFAKYDEKVPYRGTVLIDPNGVIKFVSAQSNDTGRNIEEIIRVLSAFETPGLKPENWKEGQPVI